VTSSNPQYLNVNSWQMYFIIICCGMCQPILHFSRNASMCSRDHSSDPTIASLGQPLPIRCTTRRGHKLHQCSRRDHRCRTKWLSVESAAGTSTFRKSGSLLRQVFRIMLSLMSNPRGYNDFTITGARSQPAASLSMPLSRPSSSLVRVWAFQNRAVCN
jgi:hypothetical protein